MVMEVVHEDVGEGNMQCINHQYKNGTPGGICAFCLQEKLGKLVSSSFPIAIFPSSSSSSTPSFRSDFGGSTTTGSGSTTSITHQSRYLASSSTNTQIGNYDGTTNGNDCSYHGYCNSRRSRLPFILTHRRRKKKDGVMPSSDCNSIVFKRSKSTTTPRRGVHFLNENYAEDCSPHRRGFWSFLYLSKQSTSRTAERNYKDLNFPSATPSTVSSSAMGSSSVIGGGGVRSKDKKREEFMGVEENGSPDESTFERKVSRSRSVGCGSRSFSGDFFERISTGFGDCTLRRVESQREGKSKIPSVHGNGGNNNINCQDCIKERVKCGGIFSGFMIPSSSSSSSTEDNNVNGKSISETRSYMGNLSHGRSKSWGWAFASPIRAFGKHSTRKGVAAPSKNPTPNLAAIPSLLAVSS